MFGSIGPAELLVIFLVVLLIFGADRLPELARGLGKGIREFRRAADEVKNELIGPEGDVLSDLKRELEEEADSAKHIIENEYPENVRGETKAETETQERLEKKSNHHEEHSSVSGEESGPSKLAG
ncbi:MAG: twin-arginine translocase TatA/TatE family subunit [Calditrichaeota bacterium]|nr:twin-arginine translocase TatA/TatE family subunit [Calditrichota bacterium]